ncbi:hypothetical protein BAE44_0019571, partial [Dichanthelium oligosanthes]
VSLLTFSSLTSHSFAFPNQTKPSKKRKNKPSLRAAVAAPELVEDLVEEVLLRIPPDDPASLARAALVSRRWCRVAAAASSAAGSASSTDGPPLPCWASSATSSARASSFIPTSSFCPPRAAAGRGWRVLDARHGRVLLANLAWEEGPVHDALVVWDPVTGQRLELPELPRHQETLPWTSWNAAVLCGAGLPSTGWDVTVSSPLVLPSTSWNPLQWPPVQPHEPPVSSTAGASGVGTCDHIDCRRGPFLWLCALVGNTVYSKCEMKLGTRILGHEVLKYGFSTHEVSAIHLPYDSGMRGMSAIHLPPGRCCDYGQRIVLMTTEDDAGL